MAALPTEVQLIDPITGFWSLELQEWTRHWVTGLEHVRDGAKRKHEICEAGWNAAKWENSRINRHLAAARRRGDRAEDDVRAVRQEMEQANQDALADATVQKATIAKLEEEVAQLNVEKDQLAGVGGQTEAIDRLQKQVARLEEENEKLTRDEPTLGSKVERLEAQLKDANETNRTLEDALAKQAEEKKRGNQYPKPSSRLQPPPARKEPCTHEAEFAILREEKSDAQAETYRLRAEMGKLENAIMAVRLSASQTKFECNQSQENAAELEQDLREKLSFARTSIRQFNRANDTLRDQKSHLEAAAEASKEKREKELDDLETKHQLETGGLHDRIIHLEYGIHALSEDKRINDEDKRRLEHEINCLKREYEKKIKDPKENESHTQALKDENTRPKARGNRNKKRGKGQATQLAAPMLKDSIVQKQESAMFKELTLWGSKWEYV
jgi:chromosome segregation ATPase